MPAPGMDSTAGRHRRHAEVGRVLMLLVLLALPRGGPTLAAAPGGDAPSPTLAVVETDRELAPPADLLTAQLSQKGVQLVERRLLDAILQEQALSAAGLADPQGLVKVGGLLRADAFVLLSLEQAPPGVLLRVRVAETAAGVRLLDTYVAWDPARPQQAAGELANRLAGVVARLRLPRGRLVPVGIVDFHGVQLAEERQWVCRALKTMLSARLGREPSIAVLEREDLERLREEKLLTQGPPGGLWGSAVLIDGYVNGAAGKMVAEIRVRKDSTGEPTVISEPVEEGSLGESVGRIVKKLAQELGKAPPAGAWDAQAEAAAFFQEGSLLISHGRCAAALPLMETACALEPGNVRYIVGRLGAAMWSWDFAWQCPVYVASLATQVRESLEQMWPPANREQDQCYLDGTVRLLTYLQMSLAMADERTIELNRENLRLLAEFYQRHNIPAPDVARLSDAFELLAVRSVHGSLARRRELIRKYILPSSQGGDTESWSERLEIGSTRFPAICDSGESLTEEDRAYLGYVEELSRNADPVVQLFARRELARFADSSVFSGEPKTHPPLDAPAAWRAVLLTWRDHLGDWERLSAVCRAEVTCVAGEAANALRIRRPEAWWEDVWQPVLLPAMERGDTAEVVRYMALVMQVPAEQPETARRAVEVLDSVATMLSRASPDAHDVQVRRLRDEVRRIRDRWGSYAYTATDPARPALAADIRDRAARARAAFPQADEEWALPGVPTTVVLGKKDWPQGWEPDEKPIARKSAVAYQESVLWGCYLWGRKPWELCLFGVGLRSRRLVAFWVTSVPEAPGSWEGVQGLVMGRNVSYAAIQGLGLVVLPGTALEGVGVLSTPRILGTRDGLPSPFITGIAAHGDELWLAYRHRQQPWAVGAMAEAGIGTYDPRTREWHSAHCSTLAEEHPLSSGTLWEAHGLVTSGQRCLFNVSWPSGGSYPNQITGLWSLDDSGAGAQRLCGGLFDRPIVQIADGLLLREGFFLANIDTRSQSVVLLLSSGMTPGADAWPVKKQPFFPGAIVEAGKGLSSSPLGDRIRMGNAVIHRGRLWSLIDQRIAVLDEGASVLSGFYPNNILEGQPAELLVSTPEGLVAIGKGRIGILDIDPADARSGRN